MSRKSRLGITLVVGLLLGLLSPALLLTENASAISDYDDVMEMTASLHLARNGIGQGSPACAPVDVTTDWLDILNDSGAWWSGGQYIGGANMANTQADLATALGNETGWAVSALKYSDGSTTGTGSQSIADSVRVVFSPSSTAYVEFTTVSSQKYAVMRNTDGAPIYAVIIQFHDPDAGSPSNSCTPLVTQSIRESGTNYFLENRAVAGRPTDDAYVAEPLLVNVPITYPSGYDGVEAPNPTTDSDGDDLIAAEEVTQGTSDTSKDTDGDGLDDFVESRWYSDRNDTFCGSQCAYPDPLVKDVYIEMDWMDDGTSEYKPSSAQVALVQAAFANKGVNFHADIGQYGGGNELPVYIEALQFVPTLNERDFFNLKNGDSTYSANFAESRRGIWHYAITGDRFYDGENNTTSGVAYPGDDDMFVALGQIERGQPLAQDQAIAGTIIHELGHNLCLSDDSYTGQDSSCLFGGIDTYASLDYNSSMNYNKQFSLVNYSDGLNGLSDHNDWAAILVGMDDFVTLGDDPPEPSFGGKLAFDKKPTYEQTSTVELHRATEDQAAVKENGEEGQVKQTAQANLETQDSSPKSNDETKARQSSNLQSKWNQLLLGSGIGLLIVAAGIVWSIRRR